MNATVICILGMHRSGTSLVTRVSNLIGMYVGPENRLVRPAADNPKGFWEHGGFLRINERILQHCGGSWRNVPAFPNHWQRDPSLEGLVTEAQSMIDTEFSASPLWGWKDPRTCLTLPFWQDFLPRLSYVTCVRHPIAVARSLQRRDGLALEKALELWARYLLMALDATAGQPSVLVVYEDLLRDFRPDVARLATLFGQPGREHDVALQDAVRTFIDPSLQHEGGESEDGSAYCRLAVEAYAELRRGNRDVTPLLRRLLRVLEPELRRLARDEHSAWLRQRELLTGEISRLVPNDEALIMIDDGQLALSAAEVGRRTLPFLERDGDYWGPPANDAHAISELERMQNLGIKFVAFAAQSFWWLSHYSAFGTYLESHARSVSRRPELVLFELT